MMATLPELNLLDLSRSFKIGDEAQTRRANMTAADLAASGDLQGAAAAAMRGSSPMGMSLLSLDAQRRQAEAARAWQEAEAKRAQGNADRSYGLQASSAARADAAAARTANAPLVVNPGDTVLDRTTMQPKFTAPPNPGQNKPTEAMNRNAGLYSVSNPELDIVAKTYGELSDPTNQILGKTGVPGNTIASPGFQRAKSAVETIAQSYLYSASGAAAPAEEVAKIVNSVTPVLGDKPPVVADKLARLQRLVAAIKLNAGSAAPTGAPAPTNMPAANAPAATGAPDRAAVEAEMRRRGLLP